MSDIKLRIHPLLSDDSSYDFDEVLDSADVAFFLIGVYRVGGSLVAIERIDD